MCRILKGEGKDGLTNFVAFIASPFQAEIQTRVILKVEISVTRCYTKNYFQNVTNLVTLERP